MYPTHSMCTMYVASTCVWNHILISWKIQKPTFGVGKSNTFAQITTSTKRRTATTAIVFNGIELKAAELWACDSERQSWMPSCLIPSNPNVCCIHQNTVEIPMITNGPHWMWCTMKKWNFIWHWNRFICCRRYRFGNHSVAVMTAKTILGREW